MELAVQVDNPRWQWQSNNGVEDINLRGRFQDENHSKMEIGKIDKNWESKKHFEDQTCFQWGVVIKFLGVIK